MSARLLALLSALGMFGMFPLSASAQLKIGMTADGEGTNQPARIGYANGDGITSGQLQIGLDYAFKPYTGFGRDQWEPHIGLAVADNRAFGLDTKSVLGGAHYVFRPAPAPTGHPAEISPGYIEVMAEAGVDQIAGSQFQSANLAAVFVPEAVCGACRANGWLVRPMLGAYYRRTSNSDAPATDPDGRVSGAWLGLTIQFASIRSPRNIFSYRNRFTYDLATSDKQSKEHFRFHTIRYTRLLNMPLGNQPQFSLTLERSVGADPIDVSRDRHGVTSIYFGIQQLN